MCRAGFSSDFWQVRVNAMSNSVPRSCRVPPLMPADTCCVVLVSVRTAWFANRDSSSSVAFGCQWMIRVAVQKSKQYQSMIPVWSLSHRCHWECRSVTVIAALLCTDAIQLLCRCAPMLHSCRCCAVPLPEYLARSQPPLLLLALLSAGLPLPPMPCNAPLPPCSSMRLPIDVRAMLLIDALVRAVPIDVLQPCFAVPALPSSRRAVLLRRLACGGYQQSSWENEFTDGI